MTPYNAPTAAQIAAAQAAGDAAYAEASRNDASLATRYDAYRAAYSAVRDQQEEEANDQTAVKWSTDDQRAAWKSEADAEGAALADAKMAEYATWLENAKDWKDIKGDLAL